LGCLLKRATMRVVRISCVAVLALLGAACLVMSHVAVAQTPIS
jgi:hypothetical protein